MLKECQQHASRFHLQHYSTCTIRVRQEKGISTKRRCHCKDGGLVSEAWTCSKFTDDDDDDDDVDVDDDLYGLRWFTDDS